MKRPRKYDRRSILSFIDLPAATATAMGLDMPQDNNITTTQTARARLLAAAVSGVIVAADLADDTRAAGSAKRGKMGYACTRGDFTNHRC